MFWEYVVGPVVLALLGGAGELFRRYVNVKAQLAACETFKQLAQDDIEAAKGEMYEERRERRAAEKRWEKREKEYQRQIQSMAEKVASLRQSGLSEGGDGQFVPQDDPEPYSQGLQQFLYDIDTEQARVLVEEQIEELRHRGIADDQILEIISEGREL